MFLLLNINLSLHTSKYLYIFAYDIKISGSYSYSFLSFETQDTVFRLRFKATESEYVTLEMVVCVYETEREGGYNRQNVKKSNTVGKILLKVSALDSRDWRI